MEDTMSNKNILLILSFFLMAFISNCQSGELPDDLPTEALSSKVNGDPTTSVINSEIVSTQSESTFHEIYTGNVEELWWSQDSKNLYIMMKSGEIIEYNNMEGRITQPENNIYAPSTPIPEFLQHLPPNAHSVDQSPSRNKALYILPVGPTPTPPAITLFNQEISAQLWLWQDGKSTQVGEIFDCVSNYGWSANEEIVIIWSIFFDVDYCKNPSTMLLDLNSLNITPLFPGLREPALKCCDPSPDGSQLIYISDDELFLLDSETLESYKIPAPPFKYLIAYWIDDRRLLVLFPSVISEPISYGILDLESNTVDELISEKDEFSEGNRFHYPSISPDGKWLAFTISKDLYDVNKAVWIIRLPDM